MWSPSLTTIEVIRPNPCAVTLVYVVGLISPDAVTIEIRLSCGPTFAVCTVTTPLLAWLTLIPTIAPRTTTAPTPIPTFCHVFIFASWDTAASALARASVTTVQRYLYIRADTGKCFACAATNSQSLVLSELEGRTPRYSIAGRRQY